MKKFYKLFFPVLCTLVVACNQSIEKKIDESFKVYVNNNFNDPKSLKEIISITPCDTMSKEHVRPIIDMAYGFRDIMESFDSLTTINQELLGKNLNTSLRRKFYGNKSVLSLLYDNKQAYLDYINWLKIHGNRMDYLHSTVRTNFENLDSTLYKVTYDIKTRVNLENELQIKHFYAVVNAEEIEFYDSHPTFNDYSVSFGDLYKDLLEFISLSEEVLAFKEKQLKLSELLMKTLELK